VPIYALTPRPETRRRMLLLRDVKPLPFGYRVANPAEVVREAIQGLFESGDLTEGDRVLLTHGDHTGQGGGTNTLKLLRVGADGVAESLKDL
jgi:pyruvate kinase